MSLHKDPESIMDKIRRECLCKNLDERVIESIQDLELLIERHTQNRYGEQDYRLGFSSAVIFDLVLNKEEADGIVYFLVFLLFNFPDRAGYTSLGIKKCYGYDLEKICSFGISAYMNSDDFTTINLIECLLNNNAEGQLSDDILNLFGKIAREGLPYSKEYLKNNFLPKQG